LREYLFWVTGNGCKIQRRAACRQRLTGIKADRKFAKSFLTSTHHYNVARAFMSGQMPSPKKTLINEDFCSLARRERFLSAGIYGHISSLKKRLGAARGQKDY